MKYFINCKTKEEAKAEYRKLAKRMHPDGGGDGKDMIELQRQYEGFEEQTIFGSENAFRESVYDKYKAQNADSPYFRTYTFNNGSTAWQRFEQYKDNIDNGELQRLRDENTKLRSQLYQYESVIKSKESIHQADKRVIETLERGKHIHEMEIKALKSHGRHLTKEMDEVQGYNNELISTYPKTCWATIKHLFKLLARPYDEYA